MELLSYSAVCILLHPPPQESLISSEALESISHPLRVLYPPVAAQHIHTWVPNPGKCLTQEMSSINKEKKISIPKSARVLFVEGICTSERAVDFWET